MSLIISHRATPEVPDNARSILSNRTDHLSIRTDMQSCGSPSDTDPAKSKAKHRQEGRQPDFSMPKTLEARVVGVLSGGKKTWLKAYIDSPFFNVTRTLLYKRTGFDVHWMVQLYTVFNAGAGYLLGMVAQLQH